MSREDLWHDIAPTVIQTGHFVYSSRLHGDKHSNFASGLLPAGVKTMLIDELSEETTQFKLGRWRDVAIVGLGCGYWYAAMVAERLGVPSVYAEKAEFGSLAFRRGQADFLRGKNVLLIDDVLSTGASSVRLGERVLACHAQLVGALFILDRNPSPVVHLAFQKHLVLPPRVLFHQPMQTWLRKDCPLCAEGKPFSTEYGKGADEFHEHGQPTKD